MKKFSTLKEESSPLPGKIHKYNGYAIREHEGKFHVQAAPHTGTISYHTTKDAAKSRVDYYNRLPQTGTLRRDKSDLVREWVEYSEKALTEETERERKSHAVRMAPPLTPEELEKQNESDDQIKKAFDDAHKKNVEALAAQGVTKGIKENVEYKVGDKVIPKIGPHKGQVHRVIHVHDSGHLNITPETSGRNHYHLGAAKAKPEDVTKHLTEASSDGMTFHQAVSHAQKHGGKVTYGTQSRKWHSISPSDRDYHSKFALDPDEAKRHGMAHSFLLSTASRFMSEGSKDHTQTIREVFEAAKAKKKDADDKKKMPPKKDVKDTKVKTADFDKPKDFNSDKQGDPEQAEVQAQPPQFGGKDKGADEKTEKKDNTPTPEKKGNKLVVQGPGPDDKFQPDPIVTPVTSLPDTASPRSGSQGVR